MQHKKSRGLAALALSVMLMASPTAIANATEPTDTTSPTITLKPETVLSNGRAKVASYKLYDAGKVDKVVINGVEKNLTDSVWSDLNGVKPGVFGAVEGLNTITLHDVAGNTATTTLTLDVTGPVIMPKLESIGSNGVYRNVSYKLNDGALVDKVVLNSTTKDLSNNQWSDVNGVKPGVFGAVEGLNTLTAYDALGNSSTLTFVLDTTKPAISWVTPNEDSFLRGTVPVTVSVNDNHPLAYNLRVDAAGLSYANPYTSGNQTFLWNTTTVADGRHKLYAAATDRATNKSEAFRFVTVDNTDPIATVDSPVDGTLVKDSVSVNLTATDTNLVAYSYRIKPVNGGATVVDKVINSTTGLSNKSVLTWDTTAFANGEYFVYVSGRDAAGNRAEQRIFVEVDNSVVVEPETPVVTEPEPQPEPPIEEETNPVTNPEEAPTKEKDADVTPVKQESKLNADGAHLITAPTAMKTIAPLQLAATGASWVPAAALISALFLAIGAMLIATKRRVMV